MRPLLAISLLALCACHRARSSAVDVHVSAAISLREPLEALAVQFSRAHPTIFIRYAFGASGDLATQIARGEPVPLFASASQDTIDRIAKTARVQPLCALASNSLVLVRRSAPALASLQWESLSTNPALHALALGVAATVPAGAYAEQALRALRQLDALAPKIVRGANVRHVLDLVAKGEADAGIVYATDVRARTDVIVVGPPPDSARPSITYPLVLLEDGDHTAQAREVGAFLCSREARAVFTSYGFTQ